VPQTLEQVGSYRPTYIHSNTDHAFQKEKFRKNRHTLNRNLAAAVVHGLSVRVEKLPSSALPYVTVLITEVADGGWAVAGHGYVKQEFPELILKGARTDPDVPK
jgi:phenylpyruvate tautomerase PptA (4-oxalocrotonate tautomerase family)